MKIIILSTLFCIINFSAFAQKSFSENLPISIGYFGHYYLHPGLKIGTQFDWHTSEKSKEKKNKTVTKSKILFISPQIGMYTHSGNHTGLLINADFGYKRIKNNRRFYQSYSLGLGYLTHFNSGITYIPQEGGDIIEKNMASRSYFMPTLNLELGQQLNEKFGWYSKYTLGSKLFYNQASSISIETFIELGIKINLKK